MPHLGQALWGSFRSWQLGHSERPIGVSASCARRLEVRALEWRRFGLGISNSFLAVDPHPDTSVVTNRGPGGSSNYVFIRLARSESAAHRGSTGAASQVHDSEFRSRP